MWMSGISGHGAGGLVSAGKHYKDTMSAQSQVGTRPDMTSDVASTSNKNKHQTQKLGVSQGSILPMALFWVKVNSIAATV